MKSMVIPFFFGFICIFLIRNWIESTIKSNVKVPLMISKQTSNSKTPSFNLDLITSATEKLLYKELLDLYHLLNDTKTFTVIGGEGDSGTRAVWSLLDTYGVKMGVDSMKQVRHESKDSNIFMDRYRIKIDGKLESFAVAGFYYRGLKARSPSKDLLYNQSHVDRSEWSNGMLLTARVLRTILKEHCTSLPCSHVGFKHPRSLLMLPYLIPILGDKIRIIHVVRDGREVALAHNRKFYNTLCTQFYYKEEERNSCDNSILSRILMWSDFNLEVKKYCERVELQWGKYLLVRIEDIVSGKEEIFKDIYSTVFDMNMNQNKWNELDMKRVLEGFRSHEDSYFGNKLDIFEEIKLNNAIIASQRAKSTFKYFKYFI